MWVTWVCIAIQIVLCVALVISILLHSGKGGGLSEMFGGESARLRPLQAWSNAIWTALRSSRRSLSALTQRSCRSVSDNWGAR